MGSHIKSFLEHFNITHEYQNPLPVLYSRLKRKFTAYAEAEGLEMEGEDDIMYEFEYYLKNEIGLELDSDNFVTFYYPQEVDYNKIIGDLPVLLYHHTSSALKDSILAHGLQTGFHQTNPHGNSYSGVYLTSEGSGRAVDGYHYHATQKHGGGNITVMVKCYMAELMPDHDDDGMRSGEVQFITGGVPPERIVGFC